MGLFLSQVIVVIASVYLVISAQADGHSGIRMERKTQGHLNTKTSRESHISRKMQDEPLIKLPLYNGLGTRHLYMYFGDKNQRQSFIIDTSSQYVVMPCANTCKNQKCGGHTDPYYDLKKSQNASVVKCSKQDNDCNVGVSFDEGSSWKGVKVQDSVFPSGDQFDEIYYAKELVIPNLEFYCQSENNGEFKSQLANGVVGFNMAKHSLISQMHNKGVLPNSVFALCFRMGDGILSLGGVDTLMHTEEMKYAKCTSTNSNWQVNIQKLEFERDGIPLGRVSVNETAFTGKNGVVIDSSTTDTYLNKLVYRQFSKLFETVTGVKYTNDDIKLTEEQVAKIPNLVFSLTPYEGNEPVKVTMDWQNYVDIIGKNTYSFRVFLTEELGSILGVTFMENKNVLFDADNKRLGFATSNCNSNDFVFTKEEDGDLAEDDDDYALGEAFYYDDLMYFFSPKECGEVAEEDCTAKCDKSGAYVATGTQAFMDTCSNEYTIVTKPCSENCKDFSIVRGDPLCPDTPWTECSHSCIMSRQAVSSTEPVMTKHGKKGTCNYHTQTKTCYTGLCPLHEGDYLIYADLRVLIDPMKWSYLYSEAFSSAFGLMLASKNVKSTNVEVLTDSVFVNNGWSKIHVQIHLKDKDFQKPKLSGTPKDNENLRSRNRMETHNAAEQITDFLHGDKFRRKLVKSLDEVANVFDNATTVRFKWLKENDVLLTSAVFMPLAANDRDIHPNGQVTGYHGSNSSDYSVYEMTVVGILFGLVFVSLIFAFLVVRLKREQALLEKDKGSLKDMWKKFNNAAADAKKKMMQVGGSLINDEGQQMTKEQYELELSRLSLMNEEDETLQGDGESNL